MVRDKDKKWFKVKEDIAKWSGIKIKIDLIQYDNLW